MTSLGTSIRASVTDLGQACLFSFPGMHGVLEGKLSPTQKRVLQTIKGCAQSWGVSLLKYVVSPESRMAVVLSMGTNRKGRVPSFNQGSSERNVRSAAGCSLSGVPVCACVHGPAIPPKVQRTLLHVLKAPQKTSETSRERVCRSQSGGRVSLHISPPYLTPHPNNHALSGWAGAEGAAQKTSVSFLGYL